MLPVTRAYRLTLGQNDKPLSPRHSNQYNQKGIIFAALARVAVPAVRR
jgi:hypothetical protein